LGDVHAAQPAPSRRHSNSTPVSSAWNAKRPEPATVPGPSVIVTRGGVASIVHLRSAGGSSTVPSAPTARASKRCGPSARLL
jgi:hypothetical protein